MPQDFEAIEKRLINHRIDRSLPNKLDTGGTGFGGLKT
jgi:hypothetical protein